jgi:hypothetical protein
MAPKWSGSASLSRSGLFSALLSLNISSAFFSLRSDSFSLPLKAPGGTPDTALAEDTACRGALRTVDGSTFNVRACYYHASGHGENGSYIHSLLLGLVVRDGQSNH